MHEPSWRRKCASNLPRPAQPTQNNQPEPQSRITRWLYTLVAIFVAGTAAANSATVFAHAIRAFTDAINTFWP